MNPLRLSAAFVVVTSLTLLGVTSPAFASSKATSSSTSGDLASVSVSAPALPTSDSLHDITAAAAKLPADVKALKSTASRLTGAASRDQNSASASILRSAAENVSREALALNGLIGQEMNVIADPSSSEVLALAQRLLNASANAAAANVYLSLVHPYIAKTCK
jgi:glutamine synthetase type III